MLARMHASARALKSLSRWIWLDVALVFLVFAAYSITLAVARRDSLPAALAGGSANTIPVVVLGSVARRIVRKRLVDASVGIQVGGHVLLCIAYSLLSYWLLIVLLGVVNSPSPLNFIVQSMITSGMAWQSLENVTTYVAIAALGYVRVYADRAAALQASLPEPSAAAPAPDDPRPSRFLVRRGEELHPLDSGHIICITGADDYAELSTVDGKRLVTMTLAEFEERLDPGRFVRVHRSRIVNLDHVAKAEPAGGGRLQLHMDNGEVVPTSRTGAQALRSRAI